MAGEPEVAHRLVAPVRGADEDVAGLHVAVDEPGRVRGVERGRDLPDEIDRRLRLQPALAPEHVPQARALDQLQREIQPAVLLAGADRRDDVRVGERLASLGLAQEPPPEALVVGDRLVEQLERDELAGRLVAGAVHAARRAASQQRL